MPIQIVIEQQFFRLNLSRIKLAEAVEEAMTLLKDKSEEKSIELHLRVTGDTVVTRYARINTCTRRRCSYCR